MSNYPWIEDAVVVVLKPMMERLIDSMRSRPSDPVFQATDIVRVEGVDYNVTLRMAKWDQPDTYSIKMTIMLTAVQPAPFMGKRQVQDILAKKIAELVTSSRGGWHGWMDTGQRLIQTDTVGCVVLAPLTPS